MANAKKANEIMMSPCLRFFAGTANLPDLLNQQKFANESYASYFLHLGTPSKLHIGTIYNTFIRITVVITTNIVNPSTSTTRASQHRHVLAGGCCDKQ